MATTTTTSHDQRNWWHTADASHFNDDQIPHEPLTEDQITWAWCEPWAYGSTVDAGWTGKTGGERLASAMQPVPTGEPRYDVAFTHGEWSDQPTGSEPARTLPETDKTQRYEATVFALSETDSATCWWNTTHHQATTWSHQCQCSPAGPSTIVAHSVLVSNVYHVYSTGTPSPAVTAYRRSALEVELPAATGVIRHGYDPERPASPQRLESQGWDTALGIEHSGL